MNKQQFIKLHMDLTISLPKSIEKNGLPSDTDPTQDIPIRNVELAANGAPINVKELLKVFNNLKPEAFTSIERRYRDRFDILGEFQQSVSQVAQKGVTTNFKPSKKQKKHEE